MKRKQRIEFAVPEHVFQFVQADTLDNTSDHFPEVSINPSATSSSKSNSTQKTHKCRTVWISDVHLGTRDCKDELLLDFLKHHRAEQLYLVGDFIDGWKMQSGVFWTRGFTRVIRYILKMAKNGTPIYYITGNHDEFLRRFANHQFDNIHLLNKRVHRTADNRRFLVLHGDQFDGVATCHHLLRFIGDYAYVLLMFLNRFFNRLREKYGYGYWSLAGFLKGRVKRARDYINEYEQGAAFVARRNGFDGIVCGHIHFPANKTINGVDYMNTGDWVESCTALVEEFDGTINLVNWRERIHQEKLEDTPAEVTSPVNSPA